MILQLIHLSVLVIRKYITPIFILGTIYSHSDVCGEFQRRNSRLSSIVQQEERLPRWIAFSRRLFIKTKSFGPIGVQDLYNVASPHTITFRWWRQALAQNQACCPPEATVWSRVSCVSTNLPARLFHCELIWNAMVFHDHPIIQILRNIRHTSPCPLFREPVSPVIVQSEKPR